MTTKRVLDLKKEELKLELNRPINQISKFKIKRLRESIARHEKWEYLKSKRIRRRKYKGLRKCV